MARPLWEVTTKHNRTAACFFWIGVAMSAACVAVVLARDTELFWRFEQRGFPVSGVFAAVAVLAFLATELCDSLYRPSEAKDQNSLPVLRMDKNGKVSKREFMGLMEAEFDRLDQDKSGELDVRKLRPLKLALGGLAPDPYSEAPQQRGIQNSEIPKGLNNNQVRAVAEIGFICGNDIEKKL